MHSLISEPPHSCPLFGLCPEELLSISAITLSSLWFGGWHGCCAQNTLRKGSLSCGCVKSSTFGFLQQFYRLFIREWETKGRAVILAWEGKKKNRKSFWGAHNRIQDCWGGRRFLVTPNRREGWDNFWASGLSSLDVSLQIGNRCQRQDPSWGFLK